MTLGLPRVYVDMCVTEKSNRCAVIVELFYLSEDKELTSAELDFYELDEVNSVCSDEELTKYKKVVLEAIQIGKNIANNNNWSIVISKEVYLYLNRA